MSLLEQLAQKTELNVDFHNHGQTGSKFRQKPRGLLNKIKALFYSEGFNDLPELLDCIRNSKLDVLYLTNYSDSRYEEWTSQKQIEKARAKGYEIEIGDYCVFARKNSKVIVLAKSQEVPTKQGDVVIAGARGKSFKNNQNLEETLSEVSDELTIGEKYDSRLNAVQVDGNFYFPFSFRNLNAKIAGRKHKKPVVYNADGHHPKDIGKTYNRFNSRDLKYSDEKAFLDSIKRAVIEKKFRGRFMPIPPQRIFHHILMIILYKIRDKYFAGKKS